MGLWGLLWWALGYARELPGATLRLLLNQPHLFGSIGGVRTTYCLLTAPSSFAACPCLPSD